MGCEEIRDLLALYAGGESYDSERIAVEAHVAVCAACARELDQYREARASLAMLREGTAPSGTFKSIWNGVRVDLFPQKSANRLAWFDAALRYAAVAMVGVAIGVTIHMTQRRTLPPAPVRTAAVAPVNNVAPIQPASSPRFFINPRSRAAAPAAESDGNFYLPRVESIPAGRERDF
jgi:anti-sigma factor RsiW